MGINDEWLTAKEAAVIVRCHPKMITRKANEGVIESKPHPEDGRANLYKREDVVNKEIKKYKKRPY